MKIEETNYLLKEMIDKINLLEKETNKSYLELEEQETRLIVLNKEFEMGQEFKRVFMQDCLNKYNENCKKVYELHKELIKLLD